MSIHRELTEKEEALKKHTHDGKVHCFFNNHPIEDESNIGNHFNDIRKIAEDLFSAFNKFNLLPPEFVNPNIALNQSSIFLAGQEQHEKTIGCRPALQ